MELFRLVRFILTHPLGRQHPLTTLSRFARWQCASRVGFGPTVVPFIEDAHLIISRGMTGATGNVYVGLHEYDDMAFVLHMLRPEDLFTDVGANMGTYTIMASKVVGAHCVSIEPLPATYAHLDDNIRYNRVEHLVEARNIGLAAERGHLRFSADLDTMNHVVDASHKGPSVNVEVLPLDEVLGDRVPVVMKVDVEGFERQVLSGASRTLAAPALRAIVIEINDAESRYDRSGKTARDTLRSAGFASYKYDPVERRLSPHEGCSPYGNYLFLRDVEEVARRVASSRQYRVGPWMV